MTTRQERRFEKTESCRVAGPHLHSRDCVIWSMWMRNLFNSAAYEARSRSYFSRQ
jgi:hypothetical protein